MAGIFSKVSAFARSPQGKKLLQQAQDAAKDPKNRAKVQELGNKIKDPKNRAKVQELGTKLKDAAKQAAAKPKDGTEPTAGPKPAGPANPDDTQANPPRS
jgi:hypothetical protein